MEFRQLRYFKVVADARSFVRGSQDLRVAQPALSRSIAKLEEEIGHTLFVRHSGGVSLTDAGKRFYAHATHVLETVSQLTDGMATCDEPHGIVSLGSPQSIQSKLALSVAAEFLSKFPLCRLDLIQNSGARLRDQVAEGSLDIAIVPNTFEGGMHQELLLRESACLICCTEDRSQFGDMIDLQDLRQLPLIFTGYPDSLRLYIDRKFTSTSTLNIRSEVNSSSVLVDLVISKVGYGVAPSSVIAQRPEQVAYVPIRDFEISWAMVTNWRRRGLRAVEELERMLREKVRDLILAQDWPTGELLTKPVFPKSN